jgi:hypothetical protein
MPCVPIPPIPFPTLPAPLSLALPTIATPQFDLNLCCTITVPSIPLPIPPIGLGQLGVFAAAAIQGYLAVTQQINAYIGALQISCPLQ